MLCREYDLNLDLHAKIWQLSVAEQQWVEILKALFLGVDLLILDEPTAVLTPQEADKLFVILKKMKEEGLSILFITHKLNEVMTVSDRVTVLRKGKKIATVNTAEVNRNELAKMMVGREVVFRVEKPNIEIGESVLEIKNLKTKNDRGFFALNNLSLHVNAGEIVGIAGVSGNGQRELFESIIGIRKVENGEIYLNGLKIKNQSSKTISSLGIAHVPEDRLKEGVVSDFSITDNLILGLHHHQFFKHKGWFLDKKEVDSFAENCINDFEIVTPSKYQMTRNLSGGNIQKVVLARELSKQPNCLIANLPTRGLDVGAIEYVHKRLLLQCTKGTGILLFSDDLDEILHISDRILVIFKGSIVGELDPLTTSLEKIGLLMAGILEGEQ
jgi:simple sugar transport system ATP-binding protein